MPTKLRKVFRTCTTAASGTDTRLIPLVSSANAAKLYKQGAVVAANATVTGSGTVVTVRDIGRIVSGDTVQVGTSSTNTATVSAITSRTSFTLTSTGSSFGITTGQRLVVTSNRPTVYTESSGAVSGSANLTSDANGGVECYTAEPIVDILYSVDGGSTISSAEYDVEAGYTSKVIDIRDYGGDLQIAHDALPAEGGGLYLPDGYVCALSSSVTISKPNVRLFSDSWGKATIISNAANPTFTMLKIEKSGFIAESIRFDMQATSNYGSYDLMQVNGGGIVASAVFPVTFRDCYFLRYCRNAVRITGAVFNFKMMDFWISGGFGPALYIQEASISTSPTPSGSGTPTHLDFMNGEITGIVTGTTESAVEIRTAGPVSFDQVRIEGVSGGTDITSGNAFHIDTGFAIRIKKCHFEMATTGTYAPGTNPEQLIVLSGVPGIIVEDCTVTGSATSGVQPKRFVAAGNATRGRYQGNRISNLHTGTKLGLACDGSSWGWIVGPNIYETSETDTLQEPCTAVNSTLFKVPVYADTTARDAAGGAQAVKGAIIYLLSTNKFQGYDGAWTNLGSMT